MTYTLRYWLSAKSLQSAPHLSLCLSSPAHHYWQSVFAVASTNHRRGRRAAETDDGGEEKSDGQPRGSNEAAHRPGTGFKRETLCAVQRLAFNLVYVAEVAQLCLKGTVCLHWHRWGVLALHNQFQVQNVSCSWSTVAKNWKTIRQSNLPRSSSATMFVNVTFQCMELFNSGKFQGGYG